MVKTLYARLMATQCLLLVVGGIVFWAFNIKLGLADPVAVMLALLVPMVGAAVVYGLLLDPVDRVHQAMVRVGAGEAGPLPEVAAGDLKPVVEAIARLQTRVEDAQREHADKSEIMGVINSLSDGVMILDHGMNPSLINTALRIMAAAEVASGEGESAQPDAYRQVFHARCFVPDQLALIEDETRKAPEKPRTDIIQLERPQQFLKRYSAPLYNNAGAQTGFLVTYTDITHDVVMDRLRQDFIANASHELRTPVTSVKVLLENLIEGAKDDPAVRDEFIGDAAREIDRMHDLVNDLLDLAALESGRNQLQLSRFAIEQVMKDAIATVTPQAKHRGVALEPEWPESGLGLEGDVNRVRQVLVNLVTNAVKFTPAGGTVRVRAWAEGDAVRLSIADTGIGIPAKDLPHIFDRFFRVTRGRSRLQGGSGLGLTIVKQAIDAHRGEIVVESTEGQGTTFFIRLPAEQELRVS
jgi:signal transduction histidine kinase